MGGWHKPNNWLQLLGWAFLGLLMAGGGGQKRPLPKICDTYPMMMKPGTVVPYLKKIQNNKVTVLMMSAKILMLGLLKIKLFWNNGYDIVISVHDITNKILSHNSNYLANVVMWPKFGNSNISMGEVIILQFYKDLTRTTTSESKVKFRQASNCCKRVLEAAKLTYANKTKESITSQKLGSCDFWWIANRVLNLLVLK